MIDPCGRVVLISGASRGIGAAIAERLHALGYRLSLGARDPARLAEALAGWDQERLHVARYDAEDWQTHRDWVDAAAARFGRIDGLVNNAGVHSGTTLRAPDEAELDRLWAINCKAPLHVIHCALPHLEASGAGRVINIASLSGKRVRNDNVGYAMSKFALLALTHAVRRAGWEKGVRATALCPSFVATDMSAGISSMSAAQMTRPEEVAELVAMLLALPDNAAIAELLVNCRLEDTL